MENTEKEKGALTQDGAKRPAGQQVDGGGDGCAENEEQKIGDRQVQEVQQRDGARRPTPRHHKHDDAVAEQPDEEDDAKQR